MEEGKTEKGGTRIGGRNETNLLFRPLVSYGWNYFGKIEVDDDKFVHARAHKYHDGRIDFYSLHTEPENAIWSRDEPLKYFTD